MARKKASAVARAKNAKAWRDGQPSKSKQPGSASEDPSVGKPCHSPDSSPPVVNSQPLSLDPNSPDCLALHLDNLALTGESNKDKEDTIILEDPPEDIECPEYEVQHFLGLAEPESQAEKQLLDEAGAEEDETGETSDNEPSTDPNKKQMNTQPIPMDEADEMIKALDKFVTTSFYGHGKRRRTHLSEIIMTRIRLMTATLRLRCSKDWGLIEASEVAAAAFGRGRWAARTTREWIRLFQEKGELPVSIQGTWNESVIEDEDLASAIRAYLKDKGKYIHARDIIDFFSTPEAEDFLCLLDSLPSLRTCQRWMIRMGYTWTREKRGQFADGHEREDVVRYRMDHYIPEWMRLERQMRTWTEKGEALLPKLKEGERVVVVWFHDESTFYAHDRRLTRWVHEGETAAIYKKGEGVSLMVADFISADYGWLRMGPCVSKGTESQSDSQISEDARVIFRAGKNRDGWFGTADVVQQLSRAMAIVKKRYPNEDHVFVFDNATIHTKLPEDAPNVNKMTLNPSQNVKGEKIGPDGEKIKIDMAPVVLSDGSLQQLYYPADHPNKDLQGAFKGLSKLLEERGIPGAKKLRLICPSTDARKLPGCAPTATDCCARRTMMSQPDFLNQKSTLQLTAESQGCSVIYLPKYHCELNPIEQCWGAAKRVYRDSPTSSSEADLRRNMLSALDSVRHESIRRFAERSRRFVHAYADGLTGERAAWANKEYRGHRVLSEGVLRTFDEPPS